MTEQEKREYAIDIYNAGIALDATDFAFGVDGDSHFDRLAEHLAKLGYRKDEVVIKKTAYEILHRIWVMLPYKDDPKASGTDLFWIETIENMADDFGVEVEE